MSDFPFSEIHCLKSRRPAIPEAQLFNSKPTGLGFKLKSLFRSKDSLAEEMQRTLRDSESQLTAYIIQRHMTRQVPHSAFHSLESTHMRTILSQLRDDTWYKTFSTLDNLEHSALDRIVRPSLNIRAHDRELVVLKVLQQNKLNAWMVLISELLRNQPFPRGATGRVILAICREKLVDGKPLIDGPYGVVLPPPAPVAPLPKVNRPAIRAPPMPYVPPSGTRISVCIFSNTQQLSDCISHILLTWLEPSNPASASALPTPSVHGPALAKRSPTTSTTSRSKRPQTCHFRL